jgi:hypothetical protein
MMRLYLLQSRKTGFAFILHFETRFPRTFLLAESLREDNYEDNYSDVQVEGIFDRAAGKTLFLSTHVAPPEAGLYHTASKQTIGSPES